jgi:hypothetical protein
VQIEAARAGQPHVQYHAVGFAQSAESREASENANTAHLNPNDRKKLLRASRTDASSSTIPIGRRTDSCLLAGTELVEMASPPT